MLISVRFAGLVALGLVVLSPLPGDAANTVDPDSTGATDVVQDPGGAITTLTNPLADPLTLGIDSLSVGHTAAGELRIDNGSDVSNSNGFVGHEAGSTGVVTVDGAGSTWSNSGNLRVGFSGDGTLDVLNGASVTSGFFRERWRFCYRRCHG